MISHGAAEVLKERLFDESDKYSIPVCNDCGLPAIRNKTNDTCFCKRCNYGTNVSEMQLPYACKLLFQELTAMGVVPRMF